MRGAAHPNVHTPPIRLAPSVLLQTRRSTASRVAGAARRYAPDQACERTANVAGEYSYLTS